MFCFLEQNKVELPYQITLYTFFVVLSVSSDLQGKLTFPLLPSYCVLVFAEAVWVRSRSSWRSDVR